MDREEFIASGNLEGLALDLLPKEEQVFLLKQVKGDQILENEAFKIEETLDALSHTLTVTPPPSLKSKLMGQIVNEQERPERKEPKMIHWKFISGIAASIALFAIGSSVFLWSQFRSTRLERNELLAEKQQLAENLSQTNQNLDSRQTQLALYHNSKTQIIDLQGTENSPGSSLRVFYLEGQVFLDLAALPALSEDQQFQLWAIVDGKPVDAGIFNREEGFQMMKEIQGAKAFAVTVEPRGGSTSPSLDTMVVLGEV